MYFESYKSHKPEAFWGLICMLAIHFAPFSHWNRTVVVANWQSAVAITLLYLILIHWICVYFPLAYRLWEWLRPLDLIMMWQILKRRFTKNYFLWAYLVASQPKGLQFKCQDSLRCVSMFFILCVTTHKHIILSSNYRLGTGGRLCINTHNGIQDVRHLLPCNSSNSWKLKNIFVVTVWCALY